MLDSILPIHHTWTIRKTCPYNECLHDVMCMKCVFVCVVYVYTCKSNSVDSQAKSLASLTRWDSPLPGWRWWLYSWASYMLGTGIQKSLICTQSKGSETIRSAKPIVNLQQSPNCLDILLIWKFWCPKLFFSLHLEYNADLIQPTWMGPIIMA